MNEKLKELKNQAFEMTEWEELDYDVIMERFGELIVQECAQVSEDDITDGDACCTNTADRIARQIKNHFGVKE